MCTACIYWLRSYGLHVCTALDLLASIIWSGVPRTLDEPTKRGVHLGRTSRDVHRAHRRGGRENLEDVRTCAYACKRVSYACMLCCMRVSYACMLCVHAALVCLCVGKAVTTSNPRSTLDQAARTLRMCSAGSCACTHAWHVHVRMYVCAP